MADRDERFSYPSFSSLEQGARTFRQEPSGLACVGKPPGSSQPRCANLARASGCIVSSGWCVTGSARRGRFRARHRFGDGGKLRVEREAGGVRFDLGSIETNPLDSDDWV